MKVIVGLGKTGVSVARFYKKRGIIFAVNDTRSEPPNLTEFKQEFPDIKISLGNYDEAMLLAAEEIILSPGLPIHADIMQRCLAKKIPIIGDIELFARTAKAPVAVITGSNGKSTVTSLLGEMAKIANIDVRVGGNLGIPALDLIDEQEPELYILELSSFQLETTYSLAAACAVILNISPDHMDRYETLNDYINAKQRIYHHAKKIVWNREDLHTKPAEVSTNTPIYTFGLNTPAKNEFGLIKENEQIYLAHVQERLISIDKLGLKGSHNWSNILAALAMGTCINLPLTAMLKATENYQGLPHRCEFVRQLNDVIYINDSKGTNIGASLSALTGIAAGIKGKVILIAGGLGKDADFTELKPALHQVSRAVVLIGQDGDKIAHAIEGATEIFKADSLENAVKQARFLAQTGDAVLLSPACASFDMFQNFEHRGEVFRQLVQELS